MEVHCANTQCRKPVGIQNDFFTSYGPVRMIHTEFNPIKQEYTVYFLCRSCYINEDLDYLNELKREKDEEKLLDIQFQEILNG